MHQIEQQTGVLYIVATPIGNLTDITYRAVEILSSVERILAEDIRHSKVLLEHYAISTPVRALHEHNERDVSARLVSELGRGKSMALISDAGTPLISDPGYPLVNACRQAGVKVVPIPGPSAVISALSASGLPTDSFTFIGFLAAKSGQRLNQLNAYNRHSATMVFYESPRRLVDSLTAMAEVFGSDRSAVVARELTKQFETFLMGSLCELIEQVTADTNQQRGELVIMVHGYRATKEEMSPEVEVLLRRLSQELPLKKAAAVVADIYGLRKNALYQQALSWQESID